MAAPSLCKQRPSRLHEIGQFAIADIPARTEILEDHEIWRFPMSDIFDDDKLLLAFHGLQQRNDRNHILTLCGGFSDSRDGRPWMHHAPPRDAAERLRTILMRSGEREPDGSATSLYREVAMINHSCAHNAEVVLTADESSTKKVVAIKDIKADEEITRSYCLPYETRSARREELDRIYSFRCLCQICSMCDDCVRDSDARRLLLAEGSNTLNEYLETETERFQPLSDDPDIAALQTERQHAAALTTLYVARVMERCAEEEGIVGAEVTKIWRQAWRAAWVLGKDDVVVYYIEKLINEGRRAHAVDEEEVRKLEKFMGSIQNLEAGLEDVVEGQST